MKEIQKEALLLSELTEVVEYHRIILNKIDQLTNIILNAAKRDEQKIVIQELENRTRLINIVNYVQEKVERLLGRIPSDLYTREVKSEIKIWQMEMDRIISTIGKTDQEILEHLNRAKIKVKKEISVIHRSKTAHEKYNLSLSKK